MRVVRLSAFVVTVFSLLAAPSLTYGAAQLRAGATTSAQPTAAVGTALRQMQITFDPEVAVDPAASTLPPPTFNVTSFQLTVKYDATKLTVSNSNIQFIDPYSQTPVIIAGEGAGPASGSASNAFIDPTTGTISFISGQAPVGASSPGDVNIFSIFFTLKSTTLNTDGLTFSILADATHNDFIQGTNPNDPNPQTNKATSFGADVVPTTITTSFAAVQAAQANSVPLPAGTIPCASMLGLLVVRYWRRRGAAAA